MYRVTWYSVFFDSLVGSARLESRPQTAYHHFAVSYFSSVPPSKFRNSGLKQTITIITIITTAFRILVHS